MLPRPTWHLMPIAYQATITTTIMTMVPSNLQNVNTATSKRKPLQINTSDPLSTYIRVVYQQQATTHVATYTSSITSYQANIKVSNETTSVSSSMHAA